MNKPKLVGHRGYMHAYPENTLVSIRAALDAGVDFVEFDVQMCMDGELVVIHDDTTERTGEVKLSVFDSHSNTLKKTSVHLPSQFGNKFKPEYVPTLAEVMQLVALYPESGAMVEVKEESINQWGLEKVMSVLLDVLMPWQGQCVVISFSGEAINYVIEQSSFSCGWVLKKYDDKSHAMAMQMKPDYLICNHEKINSRLWYGNWEWMLYDIIDPELAGYWYAEGSNLIETANISALKE